MSCNIKKTYCKVFSPVNRNRLIFHDIKCFTLYGSSLKFINSFKYFGHIICNSRSDDNDIKREIRNLYRTTYHFFVKPLQEMLFKCYIKTVQGVFLPFYGMALWHHHSVGVMNSFRSCFKKYL